MTASVNCFFSMIVGAVISHLHVIRASFIMSVHSPGGGLVSFEIHADRNFFEASVSSVGLCPMMVASSSTSAMYLLNFADVGGPDGHLRSL